MLREKYRWVFVFIFLVLALVVAYWSARVMVSNARSVLELNTEITITEKEN